MGSLFNPGGKKYYILEHKVSSKYHKAGEAQEIIVDNIELGRDSHCQVRFDESFKTVSRRHAAIVREGDMWKLIPLSKTNTTFLNGQPVKEAWYLQNGDEIQLSVNGPKIGFITPTGAKSTVKSIGLTRRLSLFRQQALRPYKTAIAIISGVLVLAVAGLGTWNFMLKDDLAKQNVILAQQIEANKENKAVADSLANELTENNKKLKDYEERIADMKKQVAKANAAAAAAYKKAQTAIPAMTTTGELAEVSKNVYFCTLFLCLDDEPILGGSGTAFLLDDGRLVTAQHVVNPYFFGAFPGEIPRKLNAMMVQNPKLVTCRFTAISPTGDKITKTFTVDNIPFEMGAYDLVTIGTVNINGNPYPVKFSNFSNKNDWATLRVGKTGGIPFDNANSTDLPVGTRLDVLGFPKRVGAEDMDNVTPIHSESTVARKGLDVDGLILMSNNEVDHGNSGGPVFAKLGDKLTVVGILTRGEALGSKTSNDTTGIMKSSAVPIAYTH